MSNLLSFLNNMLRKYQQNEIERYLGKSVDFADLARREKNLKRRGY
jgi:hypothetical protein